jgi:alpha-ketoglutarate-dependent taurine dioxygenase
VLLNFLSDHIAHVSKQTNDRGVSLTSLQNQDVQCRVKWSEGDVVVYDQRVVQHSRVLDYAIGSRRHLLRITPLGGRPIPTPAAGVRPETE